jgi:hypothetical protein
VLLNYPVKDGCVDRGGASLSKDQSLKASESTEGFTCGFPLVIHILVFGLGFGFNGDFITAS